GHAGALTARGLRLGGAVRGGAQGGLVELGDTLAGLTPQGAAGIDVLDGAGSDGEQLLPGGGERCLAFGGALATGLQAGAKLACLAGGVLGGLAGGPRGRHLLAGLGLAGGVTVDGGSPLSQLGGCLLDVSLDLRREALRLAFPGDVL